MPEKITLGEMKDLIKEEKLSPSDLFGVEALTSDPLVRGFVDSSLKELKGKLSGEYEARKRVEKEGGAEKGTLEEQLKAKDDELKKEKLATAKIKADALFTAKATERKLDDKQSQFIETKRGEFEPEDPEKIDKEVDKFMDEKLEEYKKTAEIFGVKSETPAGEEKPGSPPGSEEDEGEADHIPD